MSCKVQQSVCSDCVTYAKSRIKFNTLNTFNNVSGEFEVIDIKKAAYNEVLFSDSSCSDDNWYKCKVQFVTIDEKTEKEKRTSVCYLVNAHNIISCHKVIDDVMSNCMIDCDTVAVQKTKILDVFEYHK